MHFGDELIGGDGVAEGTAIARHVRAGEPDFLAIVMLAQHHGVMQAADWRDVRTMLFQRSEWLGKLVGGTRLLDLPRQRIHAVRDIEKHAALRLGGHVGGTRAGWQHGIEEWQGDGGTESAQGLAAADMPVV
jgi:hypothetical protein